MIPGQAFKDENIQVHTSIYGFMIGIDIASCGFGEQVLFSGITAAWAGIRLPFELMHSYLEIPSNVKKLNIADCNRVFVTLRIKTHCLQPHYYLLSDY